MGTVSQKTTNAQNTIHSTVMGVIGSKYGVRDRGKKQANLHVLRETTMPAILLENLFIDTTSDLNLLHLHHKFGPHDRGGDGQGVEPSRQIGNPIQSDCRLFPGSATYLDREAYLEDNGMKAVVVETVGSGVTYYRVQAGAFRDRGNAEARLAEVKALGISDAYLCENP